jgi:hypothetical protein
VNGSGVTSSDVINFVGLIYFVYLVSLVSLVSLVDLVDLVYLVYNHQSIKAGSVDVLIV